MMTALHRQIGPLSLDDTETLLGYGKGLMLKRCPDVFKLVSCLKTFPFTMLGEVFFSCQGYSP